MPDRFTLIESTQGKRTAILTIGLITLITLLALWLFTDPLAQPLNYHNFSDSRSWLGIRNAANILSNLPFILIGLFGLVAIKKTANRSSLPALMYSIFFLSLILIAAGSSVYHLSPDNSLLVFDRLPMSTGFTSLFSIIIWERLSHRLGNQVFPCLLAAGILSVLYWHWTDDLRPYVLIQFLPLILMPVLILRFNGPGTRYLWLALTLYLLAKVAEIFDPQLYQTSGQILSGHTLKHLLASASVLMILLKIYASGQQATATSQHK